jgi:hypothetical protein
MTTCETHVSPREIGSIALVNGAKLERVEETFGLVVSLTLGHIQSFRGPPPELGRSLSCRLYCA